MEQVEEAMPEIKMETELKPEKQAGTRKRKKKLEIACVYCRRSHMICDESRPCQRCIKRGIQHLCYDEPSNPRQKKKAASLRKPHGNSEPSTPSQEAENHLQASPVSQPQTQGHAQGQAQGQPQTQAQGQPQAQPPQPPQVSTSQTPKMMKNSVLSQTLAYNQEPLFYSEHAGSEFSSLNDFLSMIDDPELVNGALNDDPNSILSFGMNNFSTSAGNNSNSNLNNVLAFSPNATLFGPTFPNDEFQSMPPPQSSATQPQPQTQGQGQGQALALIHQQQQQHHQQQQQQQPQHQQHQNQQQQLQQLQGHANLPPKSPKVDNPPVISDSARDKFFLTAADPTTEISPEERLKQVIKAKLEAGLLQPYNYAKGYARLQRYMDNYMNISSRQRILKPLSIFRPAFRAIARTLKDVDLVLVEESFERMLLDYDRVFTSMAIPACLWRRTGEIYRGNKEFASLVGVTTDDLKDGKLAIYELMSEESAVNFWEKYGAIAFDKGQKAVLTSCNLRTRDGIKRKSCCFSFTIRRDRYNIPSCIVGNFIPIDP
ncbi:uncharacterized protein LODBEIA_P16340 [Lodderomyces beijingensis]|uniref:Zn(2)-C6 fungal-type domain-containing protein n=1 Tax=Lodderomyces beijingensis TaxID=1775926 RepID=A0ABP0ZMA6_9ASCO